MFPFDEKAFVCKSPAYVASLKKGKQRAAKLRAVILLLARNIAKSIDNTIKHVEAIGGLFDDYAVQVFENDSTDNTVQKLKLWAANSGVVAVQSNSMRRPKWGMVRSRRRGTHMADYRNRCKHIASRAVGVADVVIVMDSDLAGCSLDGILNTLSRWGGWDAVFSNGLRHDIDGWVQADAWALRQHNWVAKPFASIRHIMPARGAAWLPVRSAFGGMGIYRANVYASSRYSGGDCEHVKFHRALVNRGFTRLFINPSQLVVYEW